MKTVTYRVVHFTRDGMRGVCTAIGDTQAFDPDDTDINCDRCRIWLAGYRAGKADQ